MGNHHTSRQGGRALPMPNRSERRRTRSGWDPGSNALPVFQHRHVAAHTGGDLMVDARGGPAGAIRDLCRHVAPGIDDHGMAIGEACLALAFEMLAPGGGGGEPALSLDGAGADHYLPMIL